MPIKKIKQRLKYLDMTVAVMGIYASMAVATGFPQPYFWTAFPIYFVMAVLSIYAFYLRKSKPMMLLFCWFACIDAYGIYNWWPW